MPCCVDACAIVLLPLVISSWERRSVNVSGDKSKETAISLDVLGFVHQHHGELVARAVDLNDRPRETLP